MNLISKRFFIVLGIVLVMILGACSSGDNGVGSNNGYSDGIIDLKEQVNEDVEEEFILYLYATSCIYCQKMKPLLNEYVEDVEGALPVYAYDLDNEDVHPFVQKFVDNGARVEGTPTFIYYKDGDIIMQNVGMMEIEDIPVVGSYKGFE